MRHQHTLKYVIKICFFIIFVSASAQQSNDSIPKDSIVYKTNYGLRLGIDISKPIRSLLQDYNSGLEIVGDYRISKKWYVAAELGNEKFTTREDFTNSTSKGSYLKIGLNYNSYNNWLDMNNEIFTGFRYGFAVFDQILNNYQINSSPLLPPLINDTPNTESGLTAHWSEFVLGFRAEVYSNVFLTFSGSYKIMISLKDPVNFKTHYAPGFNRVYTSNTCFGFNYTISYLIHFRKK